MARYIDAKQIRYCWMIDADGTEHDGVTLQSIIDKIPTADVVPKSEIERSQMLLKDAYKRIEELDNLCGELQKAKAEVEKIFAEIEKLFNECCREHRSIVYYQRSFAELKNKYIGGGDA